MIIHNLTKNEYSSNIKNSNKKYTLTALKIQRRVKNLRVVQAVGTDIETVDLMFSKGKKMYSNEQHAWDLQVYSLRIF